MYPFTRHVLSLGGRSFIISITLRVMHSSGQAELERLDITKKEPPDYVH
jgi:hypothetical protein